MQRRHPVRIVAKRHVRAGRAWTQLLALALLAACDSGDGPEDGGAPRDAARDSGADAGHEDECRGPPGLYSNAACTVLADGLRSYQPRHGQWVDSIDRERWIYLPPGERIDSTDPDHWIFPRGTRLYQTIRVVSRRLETRVFIKTADGAGPSAWQVQTFAWNAAQNEAAEVPDGAANVLGTQHDVPSVADGDCVDCHSGAQDAVNGFSAIQLNHTFGGVTLQTLLDEGLLTTPITTESARLPGDIPTQSALGYLHANCGNCHRRDATGGCSNQACGQVRFWVNVADTTPAETDTYTTAVAREANTNPENAYECRVRPDRADDSFVIARMSTRASTPRPDGITQMPPLGTEMIDSNAIVAVSAWIDSLDPSAFPACPP